jgi:hypothetical protein
MSNKQTTIFWETYKEAKEEVINKTNMITPKQKAVLLNRMVKMVSGTPTDSFARWSLKQKTSEMRDTIDSLDSQQASNLIDLLFKNEYDKAQELFEKYR